jgi:UV DNA damage endonuclease
MGESVVEALALVAPVWEGHGPMMVDYSTQDPAKRWGAHAVSIDLDDFAALVPDLARHDADVMLEIKDKEQSALRANALLLR